MSAQGPGRTVHVLLVEDNEVDREAVRRAFAQHKIANPIVDAVDGIEALDVLRGTNGKARLPRPYLILLDINMPRMNGIELLRELRADPELRDSIVFVLTTSKNDEDKMAAYQANVAGYIAKSEVGAGFMRLVTLLDHYWKVVEFP
ncbi:MAG TPA: response regulator [Sandaracinaceae bacterium]